jgi:hypothetical protein
LVIWSSVLHKGLPFDLCLFDATAPSSSIGVG